jgi:uncharacterized protein YgfB (UPF0149 family)
MSGWGTRERVLEAADALDEWINIYTQGMAHSKAEYEPAMREVLKLATTLEIQVKSLLGRVEER